MSANYVIKELNQSAIDAGKEFVGSLISLSVTLGDVRIPLREFINMISEADLIPDSWAPSPRSKFSLYLDAMSNLNGASLQKMAGYDDLFPFPPKEHGAYIVKRLEDMCRARRFGVEHSIIHLKLGEEYSEHTGGRLPTADKGIVVTLERVLGNVGTDATKSQFKIHWPDDAPAEYDALHAKLIDDYEELLQQYYGSKQVRKFMLDIIQQGMGAYRLTSGMYFLHKDSVEALEAFRQGLQRIHPDIDLLVFHIDKDPNKPLDHPSNQSFRSVQKGITESIMEEMNDFLKELKEHREADKDTRRQTWESRGSSLSKKRKEVEKFKNQQLLVGDIIDAKIKEAEKILREELFGK